MPQENPIALWWRLVRLWANTQWTALRLRWMRTQNRDTPAPARNIPLHSGLAAISLLMIVVVLFSVMKYGISVLKNVDGTEVLEDAFYLLDPYEKEETSLQPGRLYDRPLAAMHMGAKPLLLRLRLEETLLSLRRDANGLVVVTREDLEPGEDYLPRTLSQEAALRLVQQNGFCKRSDTWEYMLKRKLPDERLPGGTSLGGRLLVFEKKSTSYDPEQTEIQAEQVLEAMQTSYAYIGFYQIEGTAGEILYQPVHVRSTPGATQLSEPTLQSVSYEFFAWDEEQSAVRHLDGRGAETALVTMQAHVRPISEWASPQNAWFNDDDGWIYYGNKLEPGDITPLLLESYSIEPDSPLVNNETRYRLRVLAQPIAVSHAQMLETWNSGGNIGGIGASTMSNHAARLGAYFVSEE